MRQGNARIGSCKVGFVLAALAFAGAAWAGEVRSLVLQHGATAADEAMLSGESRPVPKAPGATPCEPNTEPGLSAAGKKRARTFAKAW